MSETKIGRSFKLKGKTTSVSVQSDELKLTVNAKAMGKIVTEAIAKATSDGIHAISARTADGKRQLFVRTGTLASGIKAMSSAGADWNVVTPPDRLSDPKLAERLKSLVPVLRNPMGDADVTEAVHVAMRDTVKIKKAAP